MFQEAPFRFAVTDTIIEGNTGRLRDEAVFYGLGVGRQGTSCKDVLRCAPVTELYFSYEEVVFCRANTTGFIVDMFCQKCVYS